MRSFVCLLTVIFITACSNQPTATPDLTPATPDPHQDAANWIENNLAPENALVGHVKRKSIAQIMLEDKIPGLSMAFVDQGQVVWTKNYGYSNLETSEKVTDQTVFTGASLSKPLTAMAALNLVDAGVLKLDEDANTVLSGWQVPQNEFTEKQKVTLRHLISHRAGIKNDLWSSYLPNEKVPTLEQSLSGQPPSVDPATSVIAVPGERERYSNPGYSIIQKLLKDVSGDSFDNILDKLVLHPSGMKDSAFEQPMPQALQQRRAIGHDENLQPYPYRLFPYKAAGGVWTTPTDMAKFVITLLADLEGQNNILTPAMARQVFSRNRERLGFSKIFNDENDDLVFRHYGSNQGFTCYLIGSVEHKQAAVIMINSDNGFSLLDYIARAVAEYYQWDYLKPTIYPEYQQKIPTIAEYQGDFNNNDNVLTFSLQNDVLRVNSPKHDTPVKLVPVGQSAFISTSDSVKYQFYRPRGQKDGKIAWVRVTEPNGSFNFAPRK